MFSYFKDSKGHHCRSGLILSLLYVYLKMKKRLLVLFALSLANSVFLFSQTQECATVTPPGYEQTLAGRIATLQPNAIAGGVTIVPVHVHLIRESNGNSVLTLQDIQTELDSANFYYENAGLIFVECIAAEMIDDDSLYDYESTTDQAYLLTNHFTPNVINLYFANTVSSNFSAVCGYSWYPGGPDACFISGSCATNGSTLAHELGHYMGVMHTHGGSSDELVDGSNCTTEGDLLCDTPADPNISGLVDVSCAYTGTGLDANNMPYQPDVTNIMSYSRKVCRTAFTPMQYALINSTYWTDRTYLQCISTDISENASAPMMIYPDPAQDVVSVQLTEAAGSGTTVEIYDVFGRLQMIQQVDAGQINISLNVSGLAEGIYFCTITETSGAASTRQFAVTR